MRIRFRHAAALGLFSASWAWFAPAADAQLFKGRFFGRDRQPEPIIPAPLGTSVRGWQEAQATLAAQDAFVIYLHEWYTAKELGPYGRYHLDRIAERVSSVPFPVLIQPDINNNNAFNEARRKLVIAFLTAKGVTDAPQRVIIGFPIAEGLFGDEAPRVYLPIVGGAGGGGGGMTRGTLGGFGSSGSGSGGLGGAGMIRGY